MPHPQSIVSVPLTDGTRREVFEDPDGRQWVAGDDGRPLYGVWALRSEADEPAVVEAPGRA